MLCPFYNPRDFISIPSSYFSASMAARNRPRGGLVKDDAADAHEERTMWNTIVNDLRKLKTVHARAAEVAKLQIDLETKIGKCGKILSN